MVGVSVEIEILCSNGDRTFALDEESALVAARQMREDHWLALPVQGRGRDLTFSFSVDGQHVRTVDWRALDR